MIEVKDPVLAMQRRELKYLIDPDQEAYLRRAVRDRMRPDRFGLTTISSLYYDTPDRRLLSRSAEKPLYKEKLRLRSYGPATNDSPVFLEMKRKACGVVYKRRVQSTLPCVERFFQGEETLGEGQIQRELSFFRDHYASLGPAFLIVTERTAFFEPGGDIRFTIDNAPRYRTQDLDLKSSPEGEPLLPPGHAILEIKVQSALPLWLTQILDRGEMHKTSYSKVGAAFALESKRQLFAKRSVEKCLNPFTPIPSPQPSSSLWRSPRSCPG